MKRTALNKKTIFYRQDQILLENERLRHVMREMIVIIKNADVSADLTLMAVQKCIEHALRNLPVRVAIGEDLPKQRAPSVSDAMRLAREYISQDHGGFKEGDGYFEQTGEILQKLDAALALTSTYGGGK